jgi:hypothetical protein
MTLVVVFALSMVVARGFADDARLGSAKLTKHASI